MEIVDNAGSDSENICCDICKLAKTMKWSAECSPSKDEECPDSIDEESSHSDDKECSSTSSEERHPSPFQNRDLFTESINLNCSENNENDPVFQYLQQGRININSRRVARPDVEWIDKCGSGASYTST